MRVLHQKFQLAPAVNCDFYGSKTKHGHVDSESEVYGNFITFSLQSEVYRNFIRSS